MKPDKKFMQLDTDDLEFTPFDVDSSFLRNSSPFLPFTNDNKFRSFTNPNIELPFLNNFVDSDSNKLYCYNKTGDYREMKNNSNDVIPIPSDILKELGLSDEEFDSLNRGITEDFINNDDENFDDETRYNKCNPNFIFYKIKRKNPGILNTFRRYRIPYPIARMLITRIARLTIKYCDKFDKDDNYYDYEFKDLKENNDYDRNSKKE